MTDYLKYYLAPLTQVLAIAGYIAGGDWVYVAIAWFPLMAVLDGVLPRDLRTRHMRSKGWAYIPIWLSALMGPVTYVGLAWAVSRHDLTPLQLTGAIVGAAWLGVVPLVSASHELYHSGGRIARIVGRYVQVAFLDCTRMEAHVVGHHIDVGTAKDSDTARRGETLYGFAPRAVWRSTIEAQRFISDALEKKGHARWSIRHALWRAILAQVIFLSGLYALGGWRAAAAALAGMVIARFWVETFNYFQHYGQVRIEGAPIEKRHVWNHFGTLSRLLAFEISNHADHHLNAYAPYYALVPHKDSVRLPGIFTCFIAALLPPVWFNLIIKPALREWDTRYANADERRLAAAQNRAAGWEDWFGASKQTAGAAG